MFRRGKVFLFCASFLFLMILIFIACSKDINQPNLESKIPNSSDIELVKKWFDNYTFNKNFEIAETIKGKLEPNWDKAVRTKNLVEVPFSIDEKGLSFRLLKGYRDSKISLSIFSNNKQVYKGFVIAISPSKDFQTSIVNINMLNFKKEKFDGIISVFDLQGKYVDGYFVKNGRVMTKVKLGKNEESNRHW